ncbi:hypothetical protein DSCW_05180 [Desulfosarcina widdelii]|uniref:FAS1-like dehydratase domain-containing protein n=1 Tax=Desulfosarcina widdelii TaxID=947919 RepID=A0A5K7Z0W1_9BACT|nr:MaoC family dehydratase N-terminal domain-containing protein [Desulfosarcina widdelii]BBO73101.1 hypothetical protein DSCW_05180 [Desulfosarcina widdelii]
MIDNLPKKIKVFNFEVKRSKIAEFAIATHSHEIKYFFNKDVANNFQLQDIPIPLTFGTVAELYNGIGNILIDVFNLSRNTALIHVGHSFVYHKPVYANDILKGVTHLTDITLKKKRTIFKMKTTFWNQYNILVLESRWVILTNNTTAQKNNIGFK